MPREPRAVWQHRFDLEQNDEAQARLHDFLDNLARSGKASAWLRQVLTAAMATYDNPPKPPYRPRQDHALRPSIKVEAPPSTKTDPTYSDDDVETP